VLLILLYKTSGPGFQPNLATTSTGCRAVMTSGKAQTQNTLLNRSLTCVSTHLDIQQSNEKEITEKYQELAELWAKQCTGQVAGPDVQLQNRVALWEDAEARRLYEIT
jgi:hypothetical protein